MRIASGLILLAATAVTVAFIIGGAAAILLGVGLAMFGGGGLFIALLGLATLVSGVLFALKIVRPAWRLAKED